MQSWTRRAVVWGGVGWLLAACTHGLAQGGAYSIGVRGAGNQVTVAMRDRLPGYTLTVSSQSGIGEVTVAWWGNELPHPLTFRLALRGLELFQLNWAAHPVSVNQVTVSIATTDDHVTQSVIVDDGAEASISSTSPYWLAVTLPTVEQAVYQLAAPPAFVADAPRLWSCRWIDFYR